MSEGTGNVHNGTREESKRNDQKVRSRRQETVKTVWHVKARKTDKRDRKGRMKKKKRKKNKNKNAKEKG